MSCCTQCRGIERQFSDRVARRELRRFKRRGPTKTTGWLLDAIVQEGVVGHTFLDIGGGIGAIQHELMDRGAAGGTHADASPAYLRVARSEAVARGYADHMRYVEGDFVERADDIGPAHVVTLDRVVCCYPDMPAMIDAAAARSQRILGLVLPRGTRLIRWGIALVNLVQRIRRHPFRVFVHEPADVEARVARHGLSIRFRRNGLMWQVLVFTRPETAPAAGA